MDKDVKEILEDASERYADYVVGHIESTLHLSPNAREVFRTLLADAYFTGAADLMEVIREANENKENIRD